MSAPYYQDDAVTLHEGKALDVAANLAPGSVRTIVTSPPYFGLRDYGHEDQIGAEASVGEYVDNLVDTFQALRRALADDGTLWLNLGDSYASGSTGVQPPQTNTTTVNGVRVRMPRGATSSDSRTSRAVRGDFPPKNLLGVPWRVAFALQADGWILRSDIIWAKPNPMPESVTDRPTKAHEYLFLFAKQPKYYYDASAIAEDATSERPVNILGRGVQGYSLASGAGTNPQRSQSGALGYGPEHTRNKRDVWTVNTLPFAGSHFAVYPPELIRPCILAGSARGDTVLDPFSGSGTTGMVATQEGRRYVGIDVNSEYLDLSLRTRFAQPALDMTGGDA
jgi:site-specific DNA-methyltransferase (cytosine-N4-specific)